MNETEALELAKPKVGHPHWRLAARAVDGLAWQHNNRPMVLISSVGLESDGRWWQHISLSHRDRLPRWDELVEAKEWLCGTTTYAYQVAPPRSRYVNIAEHALHLFRCLEAGDDGQVLPEFSGTLPDGRRSI